MKKILLTLTLIIGINIIPVYGMSILDKNIDFKDTFRMNITSPIKV